MKTGLIAAAIVIVLVIAFAGYYLYTSSSGTYASTSTPPYTTAGYTTQQTTAATTSVAGSTSVAATTSVNAPTTTVAATRNYTIKTANNSAVSSSFLVDGSGRALYMYTGDTQSSQKSACTGGCATAWPPFYANSIVVPSSVNGALFRNVTRTDGKQQLSYNGWPLYYYIGDGGVGQINGQAQGGFYLISPSGNQITH